MSPRLEDAIELAMRAGRSTLAHFQTGVSVDLKSNETPVTIADLNAERLIREGLAARYPGESILGEEEGVSGVGRDRWVVDPIDGTKSFICGVPLYATLLSFEVGGQPQLGVCYFPALGELLYAEAGEGAFWNGRPARVSSKASIKGATICSGGHRSMQEEGRLAPLLGIAERAMATRTWGDAYGHALVATGRVEAMIDPVVARWDISAMALIVREAGGVFSDFADLDPLSEESSVFGVVSSNGHVHSELLGAFAR